jgi:hypothetical protein
MIRLLTDLMRDWDDARLSSHVAAALKFFTPK